MGITLQKPPLYSSLSHLPSTLPFQLSSSPIAMSLLKSTLLTSPLTSPSTVRSTSFALQTSFPFPTVVVAPPNGNFNFSTTTTSSSAATPGGGPTSYTLNALRTSLASLAPPGSLCLPPTPIRRPSAARRMSVGRGTPAKLNNSGPLYASTHTPIPTVSTTKPKSIILPRGRITNDGISFSSLHSVLGGGGSPNQLDAVHQLPFTPHPTAAILAESTANIFFEPSPYTSWLPIIPSVSSSSSSNEEGRKGTGSTRLVQDRSA